MRNFSLILLFLLASLASPHWGIAFYPPETIWGPGRYPDSPVWTFEGHTYIANQTTYDMSNNWSVVIDRGSEFDREGAWLMSAYRDGPLVRGWYHAERDAHKTIAYAESTDGGATFQKPGYPHNQIITNPPIPNTDFDDEGDFWITINGDYFSLCVVTAHLHGESTWRQWSLVGLSTIATCAYNYLHAPDNLIAHTVAVVPPVMLFFSFELLMMQLKNSVKRNTNVQRLTQEVSVLKQVIDDPVQVRRQQVAMMAESGVTQKAIAGELGVSLSTVRGDIKAISTNGKH